MRSNDIPYEHGQVRCLRGDSSLVQHVAHKAPMVAAVIDNVKNHFLAGHRTVPAADEFKVHRPLELVRRQCSGEIDIPRIKYSYRISEFVEWWMVRRIARGIAVFSTEHVGLENGVDDVHVIQRVDHVAE